MANFQDIYSYKIEVSANTSQGQQAVDTIKAVGKATDGAAEAVKYYRDAQGRLRDEMGKFVGQAKQAEMAAQGLTVATRQIGEAAEGAVKGGAGLDRFATTMMQVGVLYDDISYGSKNVANNLFAIGMAVPEPRLRILVTALGFTTAAFHKQIDAGLAWAGILNEDMAKGLDKSKEATDKLTGSVAGLEEKLAAAGEASRKLDDAEKERRENLAKAMTAPSQAQSNDATQAKGVLDTMGGPRFQGFLEDLITKNISGSIDPKSPAGKQRIAEQMNAMQSGVVGGDAAQAKGLLDMMSRMPAILAKWNVAMPAPLAAGAGAGQKTDTQIAKEADEARAAKIREQIAKEEEEKKKAEEKRKREEDKARAEAAQAEQARLGNLYGGVGSGEGGLEEAARNRLASGQSPEDAGAALSGQLMAGGMSGADAFMLAVEALKQAQKELDEQRAQAIVGLGEQLRQSQEESDREMKLLLEGLLGMGAGNRQMMLNQMRMQMRQQNAYPLRNNRPNGL